MIVLCLSRKKNEKVIIGGNIGTITVLDIQGDKVRLGFEFPTDISVHREEVQLAINAGGRKKDDRSTGTDKNPNDNKMEGES